MRFATVFHDDRFITCAAREGFLVDLGALATKMNEYFPEAAFPVGTDLIQAWESGNSMVRQACDAAMEMDAGEIPVLDPESVGFMPPVPDTRQVLAVGMNYLSHCREQGKRPPERPMLFTKLVSCLTGHRLPVIKWGITRQLDFEGELAVVIGKGGRAIPRSEALDHCFGYTVMNDVTARDLQFGDRQWTRGKGLDTFGPLGPVVVTRDEVPDPQSLDIKTFVNGEKMQDSSTRDMIADVADIVSFASQAITLQPGDVIATGTPSGVGVFRDPPIFLEHGDVVRIEIDGIGTLENPVFDPAAQ